MEKYRYKKKQEYSHFCFCLGLRPGVIISSILWILEGSAFSLIFVKSSMTTYKVNKEDVVGDEITSIVYYINALTVVLSFYFVIFTGISILGLITLIVQKSILFMRLYSYTSWFFAVFIYSVLAIVANVAMITNRNFFINYCEEMRNAPASYCVKKVNFQLLWLAIIIFFQGSLHIYFSIILRAYVKRFIHTRTKRLRPAKSSKRRAIIDPLDDRSSSPSPTHSVLNIKVDKMFDARTSYEV